MGIDFMINFTNYLYKNIGMRIRNHRKTKNYNQEEYCAQLQNNYIQIDRYRLSSIENGKNDSNKNPYLLSASLIEGISDYMKVTPTELIFGNYENRSTFIKLILLAIIINGEKYFESHFYKGEVINPIFNTQNNHLGEFLRLCVNNIPRPDDFKLNEKATLLYVNKQNIDTTNRKIINDLNDLREWCHHNYGFFAEPNNYYNMQLLQKGANYKLIEQSNLLIKILFSSLEFAVEFIPERKNLDDYSNNEKAYINNFKENSGHFGGFAINWKEGDTYKIFIKSFNEMWERNHSLFIDFFEKELFNHNFLDNGLKKYTNTYFNELISGQSFFKLLNSIYISEQFQINTMTGHNYVRNFLQHIIMDNDIPYQELEKKNGYTEYKLNLDITHLYDHFLLEQTSKNNKNRDVLLFIKLYKEIVDRHMS